MRRFHIKSVSIAALFVILPNVLRAQTSAPAPTTQLKWFSITVGPDTTILTEPLRPDGTVDYVAGLNQIYSKGVTPETNAFVALLPVIGTDEKVLGSLHAQILQLAGAAESKGTYVPLTITGKLADGWVGEWIKRVQDLQQQTWAPADYPDLDRWITANQRSLEIVNRAVQQPRFWFPLVSTNDSLLGCCYPPITQIKALSDILQLRAMQSLAAGDSPATWRDLHDVHLLASLIAQGSADISILAARGMAYKAELADCLLLQDAHTDKALVRTMLNDLQKLPPAPTFSEAMHRQELYVFPDCVRLLSQEVNNAFENTLPGSTPAATDQGLKTAGLVLPDWDHVLRFGNAYFSSVYADHVWKHVADRAKYYADQQREYDAFEKEKSPTGASSPEISDAYSPRVGQSQTAYSERLAKLLILTLPDTETMETLTSRGRLHTAFTILACAIECFRLDQGAYPDSPAALVPKYLPTLPEDLYGRPINYSHTASGFKLYSPGPETDDPTVAAKRRSDIKIEINR